MDGTRLGRKTATPRLLAPLTFLIPDQPPKASLCFDAGCQYLSSLGAVPPIYNVGLAPFIALDLSLFYILGIPVV